jgi:recombination protein RecA
MGKQKKISRKPVWAGKKNRPSREPVKSGPKIKSDPRKEYDERIKSAGVRVLALEDPDCLAHVRDHISTQSLELDRLINGKGIPTGRVTEIYGPAHIGKSTIMDHMFAEVQRRDGVAVLIDSEGARDVNYSRAIGVNPATLKYLEFEPENLHIEAVIQAIYATIEFWSSRDPDRLVLIGWDALGGTSTRDELEKRLERDSRPAMAASIMRKACRQIPPKLGNTRIAVVISNHEYQHLDLGGRVGVRRETYGGEAVRLLSSIRVQLFHGGWIKRSDGVVVGREIGAKLIKNRLGDPWGEVRFALIPSIGVDNLWSIYERLKHKRIIEVKGSWSAINLDGKVINFQGWSGLIEQCKADSTLFPRLVSVYRAAG